MWLEPGASMPLWNLWELMQMPPSFGTVIQGTSICWLKRGATSSNVVETSTASMKRLQSDPGSCHHSALNALGQCVRDPELLQHGKTEKNPIAHMSGFLNTFSQISLTKDAAVRKQFWTFADMCTRAFVVFMLNCAGQLGHDQLGQ